MKLNVGSGHPKGIYATKEWVNIDDAPEGTINGVTKMSVLDMPNDWTDKFETIHCIHMLEHINRNFRQEVLNQIYRVISPGGKLYLEVPDFKRIVALLHDAYIRNEMREVHIWKTSIYGKQRYNGDSHHWGFDAPHLMDLAMLAGFTTIETTSDPKQMVSSHWKHEPVILLIATK